MSRGDEYRNALESSQQRIAALERKLQDARWQRPPEAKGTPLWVGLLAALGGGGVFLFLLGALAVAVLSAGAARDPDGEPFLEPPPPTAPKPPRIGASWYTGSNDGPRVLVDVDGDGDKDIVGLFWRAPEDRSLYVAAVDRDTLEPIWAAGPYPSQWAGPHTHLVVTAKHVLVSDSRETLHVLDVKTGNTVHDLAFAGGARAACQLATTPALIRLDRAHPQSSADGYLVLDPAAGTLRVERDLSQLVCAGARPHCKQAAAGQACGDEDRGASARSKVPHFRAYLSTKTGTVRFTEGVAPAVDGPRDADWLMVSDARGKTLLWTAPAVLEGDTLHIASRVRSEVTAKLVLSFYQRSVGDFRMVARSTATGELLWSQSVADTKEGSYAELFLQDGVLLVHADQHMHSYDLESGSELQRSSGI